MPSNGPTGRPACRAARRSPAEPARRRVRRSCSPCYSDSCGLHAAERRAGRRLLRSQANAGPQSPGVAGAVCARDRSTCPRAGACRTGVLASPTRHSRWSPARSPDRVELRSTWSSPTPTARSWPWTCTRWLPAREQEVDVICGQRDHVLPHVVHADNFVVVGAVQLRRPRLRPHAHRLPRRSRPGGGRWRAQSSAHRLLHKPGDLRLVGGGQLLQRERGRPHGAVVEVRRVVEAQRRVPRLELLRGSGRSRRHVPYTSSISLPFFDKAGSVHAARSKQQGRRLPDRSFEMLTSTRRLRVSRFLVAFIQRTHSQRAIGVIPFHSSCISDAPARAVAKSCGISGSGQSLVGSISSVTVSPAFTPRAFCNLLSTLSQ
jgi:hypothetical protein